MNVFAKRPRLYSATHRDLPSTFSSQHEYYDESDELGAEHESMDEEDEEVDYEASEELRHRRAELDQRLKGHYEAIFAKYERNFEGIGDEIDLITGEIVVNNGHLAAMMNERDAGIRNAQDDLENEDGHESLEGSVEGEDQYSIGPENAESSIAESEEGPEEEEEQEEEEEEEEEEEDEDDIEDEEQSAMGTTTEPSLDDDDDLILRGFARANRFLKTSQATPEYGSQPPHLHRPSAQTNTHLTASNLPAGHSDILDQFGPELGPQIVEYIAQQEQASRQHHIEPAWRVPDLPSAISKRKSAPQPLPLPPIYQRSPSPEGFTSVWAVPHKGSRPRKALHKGHSDIPSSSKQHTLPASMSHPVWDVRKARKNFTAEEDEAMLGYIAKAQQQGTPISSSLLWKGLAAQYPRHRWQTWQSRYQRKFYIAQDSSVMDEDSDSVDVGVSDSILQQRAVQHTHSQRPHRVRKPVQKDSIITWSQALNTIASADSQLHAGLLDDEERARKGDVSWNQRRTLHPRQKGADLRRTMSAHDVDELQDESNDRSQLSAKRSSGDYLPRYDLQRSTGVANPRRKIPCPHPACVSLRAKKYHTRLFGDEEVSELTLHLLHEHQITPFPCKEPRCLQINENGFFTQADLDRHVKLIHVVGSHRVQTQADNALLEVTQNPVCIDLTMESPVQENPSIPRSNAAFAGSSMLRSSVGAFSITSHKPTVTPTVASRRLSGASASTPLTSFSSLVVNRSPAARRRIEVRDSLDPESSMVREVAPSQFYHHTRAESLDLGNPDASRAVFTSTDGYEDAEKGRLTRESLSNKSVVDQDYEIPIQSFENQENIAAIIKTPPSARAPKAKAPIYLARSGQVSNLKSPRAGMSSPAVKAASSIETQRLQLSSRKGQSQYNRRSMPKRTNTKETFSRNVILPSHEFSDEEDIAQHSQVAGPRKDNTTLPELIPIAVGKPKVPPPVTPSQQRRSTKNPVHRVLAQEDLDELSLGPDDFKIISSHTKPNVQTSFGATIKRESTAAPDPLTTTTSRKRNYGDVLAADEVDELGADECFGKSTGRHKRIKREVDLSGTPMVHRIKAQRKQTKKGYRDEARKSGVNLPSQLGSSVFRSGTPLLDLTPSKGHEVRNSEEILTSSMSQSNEEHSAIMDGLLTPSRSHHGSHDAAHVAAAIVVKTPGGTFRKCGEGRFCCGRSFCFRCGVKEVVNAI